MLARKSVLIAEASAATQNVELQDRELLQLLRLGDQQAAGQLYHRYARRLLAFAETRCRGLVLRHLEAEDVVQSAFRSFFRKAAKGMYEVPDHEELWKLLMVITLNKIRDAVDYHQAAKRDARRRSGGDEVRELLARQPDHSKATDAVFRLVVQESLDALPEKSRQIVEMRIEGCELTEIAERMGRALRTVERVLQEYRRTLKAILDEE